MKNIVTMSDRARKQFSEVAKKLVDRSENGAILAVSMFYRCKITDSRCNMILAAAIERKGYHRDVNGSVPDPQKQPLRFLLSQACMMQRQGEPVPVRVGKASVDYLNGEPIDEYLPAPVAAA